MRSLVLIALMAAGAMATDQDPAALRVTDEGGLLSYEVTNLSPYTITGYDILTRFKSGGFEALGCTVSASVKAPRDMVIHKACRLPVDSATGKPVTYSSRFTEVRFENRLVWKPPTESEKR
jgi:hypothetical protein